tara:strand:+ start:2081 stop:3202 length:1122 start_codon:yes stop_codon:yes gene_type:complete
MPIDSYKPIDNAAGAPAKWHAGDNPIGAAIANRLINNTQWIVQNRQCKQSKSWDATRSTDTTLSNWADADDGSTLTGYQGYLGGGTAVFDTDTVGVQFSTHPGTPMTIPLGWKLSPGARFLTIRVAMRVDNANGGMAAFCRLNGDIFPSLPISDDVNRDTFEPPSDFFNSETRAATDAYKEVTLTSVDGTNGTSYYELEIEIQPQDGNPRLTGDSYVDLDYENDNCAIFLCFQSGYDPVGGTEQVAGPASLGPALNRGNRALKTNQLMSKYANNTNPGKYHKVIKLTHTDTARTETWHHVVQLRPFDVTKTPFAANNEAEYILWPSVPADVVPPELGANSGASPDTGLRPGDSFNIYDVTKFTILSVTVEESF